jgi:hypothetical protein
MLSVKLPVKLSVKGKLPTEVSEVVLDAISKNSQYSSFFVCGAHALYCACIIYLGIVVAKGKQQSEGTAPIPPVGVNKSEE